jgi:hypothetical protein
MRAEPAANATTEDLQRRAGEIRASIDRTMRELEERLQANRLLGSVSTQLRTSGVALALAAGRTVVRHPKPAAAIGAAILLYSLVKRRRRARPYRREAPAMRRARTVGSFAKGLMEAARLVSTLRKGGF